MDELVEKDLSSLVNSYQRLHANPELSYQEKKTSAYIAQELRSYRYQVTEHFGKYDDPKHIPYGIVAVMKNGEGRTVLVRTDMDALPVEEKTGLSYASKVRANNDSGDKVSVMHACGHDIHMTSFLGAARLLSQFKNDWQGTLVLIGQPAEETGAGARALLEGQLYGRFPKPDFVIALHSHSELEAGKVGYCEGPALAGADKIDILIRGKGGHGAFPQLTKDPVVLAAQVVLALQTIVSRQISPLDPAVVTVGSIHGGTKFNIIPDEVQLQVSVRSYKPEVRDRIIAAIRQMTQGLAIAAGLPENLAPLVTVDEKYTPALYNDPALTRRLAGVFRSLLGEGNVVTTERYMASEDFSRYGLDDRKIPVSMFWLGAIDPVKTQESKKTGSPLPPLHSSKFAPLPRPTIKTGVKVLTAAVLDLLKKS